MWLMGVPWDESAAVGGLFGTKVVLNEFVAFIDLGKEQAGFAPISVAIATFALCGFANFSSIAIQMAVRSEEHTSELQSLMRISYAVFCLKKTKQHKRRPRYKSK